MIYGSDMTADEFDEVNFDQIEAAAVVERMDSRLDRLAHMSFSHFLLLQQSCH